MNALTRFLPLPLLLLGAIGAAAASFYPQSNPSNEEQYLLQLINAARANPAAEGAMLAGISETEITRYYSYYGVDLNQLVSQFSGYAAKPPLAFNPDLNAAARVQSLDQATNGYQGHYSVNGNGPIQRVDAAGYQWSGLGENVFAYVSDPFFGHVGLNVDWGVPALDHRANIMNLTPGIPTFKEIGISYVSTSVPNFGPYVMTEDFGAPADNTESFLVGVVYDDSNNNGAYDMGEGLGGVTITTDTGAYYTTTSASGGYVLPLPTGSGTLTITASGGGLGAPRVTKITYGDSTNVEVDFTTAQAAGPALPVVRIKASETNLVAGGKPGILTISRNGVTTEPLEVALATSGTAIPGVDVTALPKSVKIPAGADSARSRCRPHPPPTRGTKPRRSTSSCRTAPVTWSVPTPNWPRPRSKSGRRINPPPASFELRLSALSQDKQAAGTLWMGDAGRFVFRKGGARNGAKISAFRL